MTQADEQTDDGDAVLEGVNGIGCLANDALS